MELKTRISQALVEHYPQVAALLERVVAECHPDGGLLPEMARYHLDTGGKRLRAVLPVLLAEELGTSADAVYPLAAACEMLHNATLVHDDLQDGDRLRRGRPTVWARYGKAHAVNLGDAMYAYAQLCLQRLDTTPERMDRLTRLFLAGTVRVMEGQTQEHQLKERPTLEATDYFTMVENKTSALFGLPLQGAALLAGGDDAFIDAIGEAARHLGVVFQIQDDLLDLYGDKGRNDPGGDLREGKVSALVVHALAHSSPADAERLRTLLSLPREETPGAEIAWAIDHFVRCGSRAEALAEIRRREAAVAGLTALQAYPGAARLVNQLTEVFLLPIRHLVEGPSEGEA